MAYSENLQYLAWKPSEKGRAMASLLSDGRWHHRDELAAIAGEVRYVRQELMDHPTVAESDTGEWWCIPDDHTPFWAPDDVDMLPDR